MGAKFAEGFYNMAKVIISPEHTCHGVSDITSPEHVHLGLHVHEAVMDRLLGTWLRLEWAALYSCLVSRVHRASV